MKPHKLILIIAAAAAVLGLAITAAEAWQLGIPLIQLREGRSITIETTSPLNGVEERTLTCSPDCAAIVTDLAGTGLKVTAADREDILVRWWEGEEALYTVEETAGTLTVKLRDGWHWFVAVPDWDSRVWQVEIEVPADYAGVFTLGATSGEISLRDVTLEPCSAMETTSGDVRLTGCTANGAVSAQVTSGSIALDALSVSGDLSLEATSGDMALRRSSVSGNLLLNQTSGGLEAAQVSCGGTLELTRTSGGAVLEDVSANILRWTATSGCLSGTGIDVARAVELNATSGDVGCTLTGELADYDVSVDTTSGDTNLPQRGSYGDKVLSVSTTSGDVFICFSED